MTLRLKIHLSGHTLDVEESHLARRCVLRKLPSSLRLPKKPVTRQELKTKLKKRCEELTCMASLARDSHACRTCWNSFEAADEKDAVIWCTRELSSERLLQYIFSWYVVQHLATLLGLLFSSCYVVLFEIPQRDAARAIVSQLSEPDVKLALPALIKLETWNRCFRRDREWWAPFSSNMGTKESSVLHFCQDPNQSINRQWPGLVVPNECTKTISLCLLCERFGDTQF